VAITYGTAYYVMRAANSATSIQITDSYSNALSGTATIFTASFITTGKFDLDASYSPGTGYSVGDVVYIKNPVLKMLANPLNTTATNTVDVAFTGTSFFRVEATDSTGAVTAISVLNSGTLVRKEDEKILQLFGRQTYPGSNQWEYYVTGADTYGFPNKMPISVRGGREIDDKQRINVHFLDKKKGDFEANIYNFDVPRYNPYDY
jgi:flagellar basal body rod protein FlgG